MATKNQLRKKLCDGLLFKITTNPGKVMLSTDDCYDLIYTETGKEAGAVGFVRFSLLGIIHVWYIRVIRDSYRDIRTTRKLGKKLERLLRERKVEKKWRGFKHDCDDIASRARIGIN